MSRDKQIEEMAFDLCCIDRCKHLPQAECNNTTCAHCEAEALYTAGYRKASDVAREIFEEIDNLLLFTRGVIDETLDRNVREENYIGANLMSNNRSLVETLRVAIACRKKKFTEDGK